MTINNSRPPAPRRHRNLRRLAQAALYAAVRAAATTAGAILATELLQQLSHHYL